MCTALRDLMKNEIQEEFSNHYKAVANAFQEETVRRMLRKNEPISNEMKQNGYSIPVHAAASAH